MISQGFHPTGYADFDPNKKRSKFTCLDCGQGLQYRANANTRCGACSDIKRMERGRAYYHQKKAREAAE